MSESPSSLRQEMLSNGYIIVDNFYTIAEINKMRNICLFNMKIKGNMTTFQSKPNFMADPDYSGLVQCLRLNDINAVMKQIFNAPYRFCSHNDIGLNRVVTWHKDTLNNQYKKYQITDIWNNEHEIYKVLLYLQDNRGHDNGLTIIEKSFMEPDIRVDSSRIKTIHNKVGSLIIIDQRITHRGQQKQTIWEKDRILISLGFGKNNIFTDEFERGTVQRQNEQNGEMKRSVKPR